MTDERRRRVLKTGRAATWGLLTAFAGAVLAAGLAGCSAPQPAPADERPASAVVGDPTPPGAEPLREQVGGTGPFAPASGSGGRCDRGFIADPVGGFEGEPSAGDALVRWLEGPRGNPEADPAVVPEEVPADGWVAEQEPSGGPARREWQTRSFTSGEWRATAIQSSNGSWMVNELGCTTW